jgi:serine/threonine-protein kinase
LNSLPAARVLLDGVPLGFTPRIGVTVNAGEHKVLFRTEDGEKRTTVRCARGENKTIAVRFHEPPPEEDLPVQNPYR